MPLSFLLHEKNNIFFTLPFFKFNNTNVSTLYIGRAGADDLITQHHAKLFVLKYLSIVPVII